MALLKCEKCQKTFWTARESQLCPICMVIEKGKQLIEKQQVSPRKTFSRESVTVAS